MVLDGKSSQEYPVNAGVPQCSILGHTLFMLYINELLDDVICNDAIYAESTVEFDEFLSNFENLLNFVKGLKPSFTIIMSDYNARSKSWWPDDITSPEGTDINSLTTMHASANIRPNPSIAKLLVLH